MMRAYGQGTTTVENLPDTARSAITGGRINKVAVYCVNQEGPVRFVARASSYEDEVNHNCTNTSSNEDKVNHTHNYRNHSS